MSCMVKLLGSFDLILGLVSLIIQIIAAVFGDIEIDGVTIPLDDPTSNYGAGIWCGVVFLLAGIAAFLFARQKDGIWKIVLIVLAVLAICCGVVQVVIAGVTLNGIKDLGTIGEECIKNPKLCINNANNSTLLCEDAILGNFCTAQTAYHAILISSGCIAVLSNFILILIAFCSCCC